MDDLHFEIDKILKMNDEEQRSFLRHFSRFSINQRVEILPLHNSIFHKLRQKHNVPVNILSYIALILAIEVHLNESKSLNKLNINDMSLDEIREISSKKAKVFLEKQLRVKSKRDQLISYWAVVKTLKNNEKYSFRLIAAYLKKHHKFEVTYGSIYNLWVELEDNKGKNNG